MVWSSKLWSQSSFWNKRTRLSASHLIKLIDSTNGLHKRMQTREIRLVLKERIRRTISKHNWQRLFSPSTSKLSTYACIGIITHQRTLSVWCLLQLSQARVSLTWFTNSVIWAKHLSVSSSKRKMSLNAQSLKSKSLKVSALLSTSSSSTA